MLRYSVSKLSARSAQLSSRSFSSAFTGDYLSLETKENGVAIVRLDDKSSKVNALNAKMQVEIETMLDKVEKDSAIKSVVLISGKPGCFIAGADIEQLNGFTKPEEFSALTKKGQAFMNRIAGSKKPFVAAIDGACMGGGLEVALACHYRIASSNKKTVLSLPEVQLGLLPGAGGTQRLPKLIGLQKALPLLLTGQNVKADKAKKLGIVNQLADIYALESAAIQAAEELAAGKRKAGSKKKSILDRALEDTPLRNIVFSKAKEQVMKQTGGNYPAPLKILECVQEGVEGGFEKGSEMEARNFGELGATDESRALISIFFGMRQLKKNRFGNPEKPVKKMAVIGAGLMGAGIAQVSAQKGTTVFLKDRDASAAYNGVEGIREGLEKKVKRKRMTSYQRDEIMSKIYPLSDEDPVWKKHISEADLAIEAVFEEMSLKHKIIQQIEEHSKEDCIIATNTSALSVGEIAKGSKRPENVIGMHYFSPVPQMPLLEIITHEKTSKDVAARAVELGIRQGKTCIIVKDVAGFYVNRCLGPCISETLSVLEDGVAPDVLDKALKKFGLPVGPVTLLDQVGVDVVAHVNETLRGALGTRMIGSNPNLLDEMVAKGLTGKKGGKGFYIHGKGKKDKRTVNQEVLDMIKAGTNKPGNATVSEEDMSLRLMSRFVNEAVLCLQDEVIESPTDGDMGAVFGMGFPPFIGGPFRFVDKIGSTKLYDHMLRFQDQQGEQFQPCDLLKDMAKTNKKFYGN